MKLWTIDNLDENICENGSEISEEGSEQEYYSNLFENNMQSRVKHVTSGKVSRISEGSALGVPVTVNDPLYESICRHLSENFCDLSCLSAFNNDDKGRKKYAAVGKITCFIKCW